MEEYDNELKGGFWTKTAASGLQYWSGSITVEGKEYWMNLFRNERKEKGDNKPVMNLQLKPKEDQAAPTTPPQQENDIPF